MDTGELPVMKWQGCQSAGCLMWWQIEWEAVSRESKRSLKCIIWWHVVFISGCMKESQYWSSRASKYFNNNKKLLLSANYFSADFSLGEGDTPEAQTDKYVTRSNLKSLSLFFFSLFPTPNALECHKLPQLPVIASNLQCVLYLWCIYGVFMVNAQCWMTETPLCQSCLLKHFPEDVFR